MHRPIVVLKFGGSVLRDRGCIPAVVDEVVRWHRRGNKLLVVVSAFEGVTDALYQQARDICAEPPSGPVSMLLATGEMTTCALLGLALHEAGVPATTLSPHELELRVTGDPLDAEPETVNVAHLLSVLHRAEVVVLPGFFGIGAHNELQTLGRGGSDLTAICLAHLFKAVRCRLIKDVCGLYDRDPNSIDPAEAPPQLYRAITHESALAINGRVIQHKAVRYAQHCGMQFEVGGLDSEDFTLVGAKKNVLEGRLTVV